MIRHVDPRLRLDKRGTVPLPSGPILLETKLYTPAADERLVGRPKLLGLLDVGAGRRLTLVAAPTGFGKTTLLAAWCADRVGSSSRGLGVAGRRRPCSWSWPPESIRPSRWPAAGPRQLAELGAADLRFTLEEATELLNERLGRALDSSDVVVLYERTEGWPAGLYLAAVALGGHGDLHVCVTSFPGCDRHALEYLGEEFLGPSLPSSSGSWPTPPSWSGCRRRCARPSPGPAARPPP